MSQWKPKDSLPLRQRAALPLSSDNSPLLSSPVVEAQTSQASKVWNCSFQSETISELPTGIFELEEGRHPTVEDVQEQLNLLGIEQVELIPGAVACKLPAPLKP